MVECHPTRVKHRGRDKFGLLLAQSSRAERVLAGSRYSVSASAYPKKALTPLPIRSAEGFCFSRKKRWRTGPYCCSAPWSHLRSRV
jgi:hypothetical protein